MSQELLIYADYEVAVRYRQKMDKSFLISLFNGAAVLALSLIPDTPNIPFYFLASIPLLLGLLSYSSRGSMLKDAQNGLLVFKFTPEGWYRNEGPILYRWEDFEKVEFADRAIIFSYAKQHKVHYAVISPMLMTESDFDKVDRWIWKYIPAHMKP